VLFQNRPLESVLDHVAKMGLQAVELGTGAWPGNAHCDPVALLKDPKAQQALRKAVESRGLMISAFSCHGNPLHPNRSVAADYDRVYRETVRLASEMGVGAVWSVPCAWQGTIMCSRLSMKIPWHQSTKGSTGL
jgi:sugar phosphate isomerase/epimerase